MSTAGHCRRLAGNTELRQRQAQIETDGAHSAQQTSQLDGHFTELNTGSLSSKLSHTPNPIQRMAQLQQMAGEVHRTSKQRSHPHPIFHPLEKVFWSAPMNVTTMGARVDGRRLPKTLFELGSSHLQPRPRKLLRVVLIRVADSVLDVEVETNEGENF